MQVLHLEDHDLDAGLIAAQLQESWPKCHVHRVATRAEYESALETENFDLILSDYSLTNYDGRKALELARVYCPEKPFIFFSGTIGEDRAIEALKLGAWDYICKDRPSRLLPAIGQALTRAEEIQRHARTDEALRQNRERFQQIAENVTDLIVMFDRSAHCVYCNPAYCATVGRPPGDSYHNAFIDVHVDDRHTVQQLFFRVSETGVGARIEERLVHAGGAVHCVEAQYSVVRDGTGSVVQVLMVARDITTRRAAEERIRQQAALLDHAQDVILVRGMDDRITYWNQSAATIYGWSAEKAIGRIASELWVEDSIQIEGARHATIFYGAWKGEIRQRTRANDELLMQSRWTLVQNPDGSAGGFLVINTDIAEKKRFEAQFLRAQRTESIGLLAGGIAHDINNALLPILLSIDLLEPMAPKQAVPLIATIRSSAQHGADLVRQLLAFARGAVGQQTELALAPLLKDLVAFLVQTLPPEVRVESELPTETWLVRGDSTQLKQVLMNLCLNARDAMPNGGPISITLGNAILDKAEATALRDLKSGPHVVITVRDAGCGMSAQNIAKIFDPFFTTKEIGKGTGLGLTTVRGIVKGHGGAITVESELGRGSTFRIYLPACVPAILNRESLPPMPESQRGSGEGILVVDDDADVGNILCVLLEESGYRPFKARSGAEGFALFQAHQAEISLVITDITMPEMNGFALVQKLRACAPQMRIVAMSGMGSSSDYERQARVLVVPLIAKPLSRGTLLATIAAVLAAPLMTQSADPFPGTVRLAMSET